MELFEKILVDYIKKPYRPEYLYKKVKDILNDYNYVLIKKTELEVIKENYYYFQSIFGYNDNDFKFNDKITEAKSIENFKNLIYESCKLKNFKNIDKKVIVSYLFILDNFKERIINSIYETMLNEKKTVIFEDLFNNFLLNNYGPIKSIKQSFDEIYFNKWMEFTLSDETIIDENKINDDDEFNSFKMKINFEKFQFYGPDETKLNYVINQKENIPKDKVILYTPDYLIENKILKEYNNENFQIFNKDNTCPDLFVYTLEEAIKQLNKKLEGEMIDERIVEDIGIISSKDLFNGIYLNMTNPSSYYEMKNVIEGLNKKEKDKDLHVVIFSSSTATKMKTVTEDEKLSDMQDFYLQYNAHVNEEQLSHTLVNYIGNEIKNEDIEILPRIIFYFNLYILDSSGKTERIVFTAKEKGYGFEEVDGLFYLKSQDIILNNTSDIPFLKIMRFKIYKDPYELPEYISNEQNSKILIEKESLIYMEVKTSFPLKFVKINQEKIIQGFDEANSLIRSIMRKSNKFTKLVLNRGKIIQNVHILFMYDTLLQKEDDLKKYINKFREIFQKNRFKVEINTTFDVIYFVNPSSINTKRLSKIISELKEVNEKSATIIAEIRKQNEANLSEIKKSKEKVKQEIKAEYDSKIEEITKSKEKEKEEIKAVYDSKLEQIDKEKQEIKAVYDSKLEQIAKEKQEIKAVYDSKLEEIRQKLNIEYNSKFEQMMKINENLSKKLEAFETKFNISIQNKENKNTNEIIELNINNNSFLINSKCLSVNTINNIIKNFNDTIDNFQISKKGTIYLICNNRLYIISQNLFKFLEGYRKVVLPLNNGNLLTSKNTKILLYSNDNYEEATEFINIKDYPRQIILLQEENKFLYLTEESKIILIEIDSEIKKEIIYENKKNNISSIISVNNCEIAIIFKNRIIMFFNIEKKKEIKILKLNCNANINLLDNSFIVNGYLYIASIDSMFKIDINKKEINKKFNFGFAKIYSFNNDIYGVNKNSVYKINDGENKNDNEKELMFEDSLPIRCLYKMNKKQIIFCTENQIKLYELTNQNLNNY